MGVPSRPHTNSAPSILKNTFSSTPFFFFNEKLNSEQVKIILEFYKSSQTHTEAYETRIPLYFRKCLKN